MLRDGRQRTITAKWPPSRTPQVLCHQPPAGEADKAREGLGRADTRFLKFDPVLARWAKCNGRQCKVHYFSGGNGSVLSPISELSVRITSPIVGPCVSAPSRMIPLPAVESPKYHSIADNPCASIPIHILVTVQAHVFIPIPSIRRRGVGSDRHRGWRFHHYWWRKRCNINGRPVWAWPHRHKTTGKQPSHSDQTHVIYFHFQRTFG
jgi:hypothetical protein